MDSLTQVVLGASVAVVCVPPQHRRKAAVIGAVLGTLPDLDVFIDYGDAVSNFTYHRGFTHSLFVLFPFSLLIWAALKKFYQPVKSEPKPWLYAIVLALITHPLLDSHTAYGTQLFWPMTSPPVGWHTIFIIDPLYTLPLLIGVLFILIKPLGEFAAKCFVVGLIVSHIYLASTWAARFYVESQVVKSLGEDAKYDRIYTTPTPFNAVLWRVLVMQGDSYLEGYYSLLDRERGIDFKSYSKNTHLFEQTKNIWAAKRLDWFAHGLIKTEIVDDYLVISDLRMGYEGKYVFGHAVAEMDGEDIREITSTKMPFEFDAKDFEFLREKMKAE